MIKTVLAAAVTALTLASQGSAETLTRVDVNGKGLLVISDYLTEGTADRVDSFLISNPDIREVAFNSLGGKAAEGVDLADVLYDHDIKATVNTGYACLSACAYAFIGATDFRINGVVGFHNAHLPYPEVAQIPRDQLVNVSIHMGSIAASHFIRNGFIMELPVVISAFTSKSQYIVFDNTDDLWDFVAGDLVSDLFDNVVDDAWIDEHLWDSTRLVAEGYIDG